MELIPENRHASPYGFAQRNQFFPDNSRSSPDLELSCIQANAGDHRASAGVTDASVAALQLEPSAENRPKCHDTENSSSNAEPASQFCADIFRVST